MFAVLRPDRRTEVYLALLRLCALALRVGTFFRFLLARFSFVVLLLRRVGRQRLQAMLEPLDVAIRSADDRDARRRLRVANFFPARNRVGVDRLGDVVRNDRLLRFVGLVIDDEDDRLAVGREPRVDDGLLLVQLERLDGMLALP